MDFSAGRCIALHEVPLKTVQCDYLLPAIRLNLESDDFRYTPIAQRGGLGKMHQLFGEQLNPILDELTLALVA